MNTGKVFIALLMILSAVTHSWADTIILKSGQQVDGKIVEKADKYVKIDFQGVILTYYSEEIASIIENQKQVKAAGDLGLTPAYALIDFAALSEHYPSESEIKNEEASSISEVLAASALNTPDTISQESSTIGVKKPALPASADLSAVTANLPQNISQALSSLPPEYQDMVKEAMKNIPQSGSVTEKKDKHF